ncbi:MAG TPA: ThiF family adenylyltransferase [Anaeromyxobacter sp.]|nr:ThiF family adenylyltransferase [Anaeromyxobacter sp.]
MLVGDWVLRAIDAELGDHPPERGGALLGPRGRPLLARFAADPDADATASSWAPSRALDARVKERERADDLELKGLVHSHRPGLDGPSERDALELAEGLRRNPHLALYLGPVVSGAPHAAAPAPHEVELRSGARISFHAARRAPDGGTEILPVAVRVVPLLRDLERAAAELGGERPEVFLPEGEGGAVLGGRIGLGGGLELLVLAADAYPALPPVVLLGSEKDPEQLHLSWALELPEADRLAGALRAAIDGAAPLRRAYGPRGGPALTRDPGRARLAAWEPRLAGDALEARSRARRAAVLSRGAGLLSGALRARGALVAGCGSVGSYVAEQLVRSGVGRLALLDPDAVGAENLSRTVYGAADVGAPKTEALARRLLAIEPGVELALAPRPVQALEPAELDRLVREADLVVAATDDPAAQRALDRFAFARGRPALFVGLYAGARGGEVVVTVPGRTPCFLCATRSRHGAASAAGIARELDYGTGRLAGEIALGADVQHVASAAVKLALSLLLPPGSGASLASFAEEALAAGTPYLTMSTVPGYWFYPQIFGDAPGQGAYQSVWLTPRPVPDCPVCGPAEGRVDPLDVPLGTPPREAFEGLLDADPPAAGA